MEKTKEIDFNEIIDERIHKVAYNKCINDPEYKSAHSKAIALMDRLRNVLSNEEQMKLLNELESALYIVESFFLEYAYHQGLEDSQMIYKEMILYEKKQI